MWVGLEKDMGGALSGCEAERVWVGLEQVSRGQRLTVGRRVGLEGPPD